MRSIFSVDLFRASFGIYMPTVLTFDICVELAFAVTLVVISVSSVLSPRMVGPTERLLLKS